MTAQEKISKIAQNWFLTEPLIFSVYCTHKTLPNENLSIPFRVGKRKIEFCPSLIERLPAEETAERLYFEVVRIILKHPYKRLPPSANKIALALASDITISDNLEEAKKFFACADDFSLPKNLCFEEYYAKLVEKFPEDAVQNAKDFLYFDDLQISIEGIMEIEGIKEIEKLVRHFQTAELWEEDDEISEIINREIERSKYENAWGSISGKLRQTIEASLLIEMDYRRILSGFRASVISTSRRLTRMKPNRRYGFSFMGSRRDFTTKLLIAVDVSGSISDHSLEQFFSIINRFFKYGIEAIDVLQFDADLTAELIPLKKARKNFGIIGRGGTDFQPAIDFYEKNYEYDGLIFFTDGCAEKPKVSGLKKILWILTSRQEYNAFVSEMLPDLPKSRATYIPS